MKLKLTSIAIITVMVLMMVAFSKPSKDATNDIIEANKKFVSAFNSNNAAALSQIYTKSGKIYPSNSEIIEGQVAIKNFWQNVFTAGITYNH